MADAKCSVDFQVLHVKNGSGANYLGADNDGGRGQ